MGLGAGISAGKAFVEFILSDKKLDGQLAKISGRLRSIGSIGAAATAPLIAGFTAAALIFANVGSELADMSARTGATVENLSELKFAASAAGVPLNQVEKALRTLQQKGLDPLEFDRLAADIAAIPDPVARAQAAMELFGTKTGAAILPLLNDLPALREEAQRLGLTMSTEDAAAADAFGDALDATKAQLTQLAVEVGAAIAGPLTDFLLWSQDVLVNVIEFVRENPRMVAAFVATATAIAAASTAAVTFGIILAVITAHPIVAALTLIAALVIGLVVYFGLAKNAAKEFKQELDKVKALPGMKGAENVDLSAQAQKVQHDLTAALKGNPATASPGAAATARLVNVARMDELLKWSEKTAAATARLVQLAGQPGGIVFGTN